MHKIIETVAEFVHRVADNVTHRMSPKDNPFALATGWRGEIHRAVAYIRDRADVYRKPCEGCEVNSIWDARYGTPLCHDCLIGVGDTEHLDIVFR